MSIVNFFVEECKTQSDKIIFGLCDDEDNKPAYIDDDESNKYLKWIGKVYNDSEKMVDFYPVDNCVDMRKHNGEMDERCEGFLSYSGNNIIFTELKNRKIIPEGWRKKAEEQIMVTIKSFFDNYDKNSYKVKAWICNKQLTNQNYYQQINEFRDKTKKDFGKSCVLYIQNSIYI